MHVDLFDNPTAHYADIILPASSTWESSAIRAGFRSSQEAFAWTQAKTPVVAPRHESRPDLEIIFDLAVRLGLDSAFFGGDQEAAWNHHLSPTGLTMADLKNSPGGIPFDTNTTYRKYSRPLEVDGRPSGFATPSGRLELFASAFPAAGYPPPARSCRAAGQPAGRRSDISIGPNQFPGDPAYRAPKSQHP